MFILCTDNKYDKEMRIKNLIILFLVFGGCTLSSVWAYPFTEQPIVSPSFQFQSTSTCISTVGSSSFTTTTVYEPGCYAPSHAIRKTTGSYNPWDENGDGTMDKTDPSGLQIGQVDTPIDTPQVLLIFALLYCLYLSARKLKLKVKIDR